MGRLRAGYARLDITPGPELSLLGYEFRQAEFPAGNAGILDPLAVRALVLDDGERKVALVALDLCIISVALARRLRERVAEALRIDPGAVIVSCIHTHSGPWLREEELGELLAPALPTDTPVATGAAERRYVALVAERTVEACAAAAGLTFPVSLSVRQAALGLGYRRRCPTATGVRHCWNPQESPDLVPGPHPDPVLVVAELRQIGGPRRVLLINYGAHPVVLGKTSRLVSADWPGTMNALLESWLPNCRPLFLLGACGDVHPWIATQEDPAGVALVGRAAAAQVSLLAEAGGAVQDPERLWIATKTVRIGPVDLDLAAVRFGSLGLVAAPVELFAGLGARVRASFPHPVMVLSNANGWTGYWPDAESCRGDDYEANAARAASRSPGDGELLAEAMASLLAGLPG